jgi:hypothetical protein
MHRLRPRTGPHTDFQIIRCGTKSDYGNVVASLHFLPKTMSLCNVCSLSVN